MRWPGFRKVRGQVCKRIGRRCDVLGLESIAAYRSYLEQHPGEWAELDALCRVTISRFYRDRATFEELAENVLPRLAEGVLRRGERFIRCWSAGCCSGEEAYSLRIIWELQSGKAFPDLALQVLGTDADEGLLERARAARYGASSLKELSAELRQAAFEVKGAQFALKPALREHTRFERRDIRRIMPAGPFDLVLCRNFVFTYFDETLQAELLTEIVNRLRAGGVLVLGSHEVLPEAGDALQLTGPSIYTK
jgi:chemotaxis protein methyltransferase CheR